MADMLIAGIRLICCRDRYLTPNLRPLPRVVMFLETSVLWTPCWRRHPVPCMPSMQVSGKYKLNSRSNQTTLAFTCT